MKAIGKTFADELKAAGLLGLPFSWGEDGSITFGDDITPSQKEAVMAVYNAHDESISIKQEAWNKIKAERDFRRFEGGVKVGGHWFLSTQAATGEYNSILNLGLPAATVIRPNWRTMDGAEVPMSPELAKKIIVAGFAQAAAIDDAATSHKAAMEASADPAAYDFSTGWPPIYGA